MVKRYIFYLYKKDKCPHCDNAFASLYSYDIEPITIYIDQDEKALDFIRSKGFRTVPIIYLEDTVSNTYELFCSNSLELNTKLKEWFKTHEIYTK